MNTSLTSVSTNSGTVAKFKDWCAQFHPNFAALPKKEQRAVRKTYNDNKATFLAQHGWQAVESARSQGLVMRKLEGKFLKDGRRQVALVLEEPRAKERAQSLQQKLDAALAEIQALKDAAGVIELPASEEPVELVDA